MLSNCGRDRSSKFQCLITLIHCKPSSCFHVYNFIFLSLPRQRFCFKFMMPMVLVRHHNSCANTQKQRGFTNEFYVPASNKRRRMRGIKQHHKLDCCLLFTTHNSRAWLRVGASEMTISSQDQWERFSSLPLVTSRFAFWLVFVAATHIFFGIMRSFFYGILLSVVCFST